MAQELEFSVMQASAVGLQPLLDVFTAKYHIDVHLRILPWDFAWGELVKMALYGGGPDVSEVGSTWLGDLASMNALGPFEEREVATLGKTTEFLPLAWRSCQVAGQPQTVWAIPWVTGARLIFFRRNLFEKAGIAERDAFASSEQFTQTLARLQAGGVGVPWTVPTGVTHTTLLNAASWVWGAGGDFITADGKQSLVSQPLAVKGLEIYYSLGRFIPPAMRHLTGLEPDLQFLRDPNTAVTMSGPWLFKSITDEAPGLMAQIGVALPPGPSFVGGSQLVIWKLSQKREAALKLINFLTQTPAQLRHSQNVGLLPAKLEALAGPPFSTDPLWQLASRGLDVGRSFPITRFWGLMEDRLTTELSRLWRTVFAEPNADLNALIRESMEALAKRLDLTLRQP